MFKKPDKILYITYNFNTKVLLLFRFLLTIIFIFSIQSNLLS